MKQILFCLLTLLFSLSGHAFVTGNEYRQPYDPQVEFLEVGVAVNGVKSWKGLGSDVCGTYGGCMGIGGLESVVPETGAASGIITDYFGNSAANVQGSVTTWNSTKVGGYGVLPGNTAKPLSSSISLTQAAVWRGKVIDPTGFYYWGARPYDPQSGRFLSPDPAGHSSSMTLYDYAGNDPINRLDADGRVASGFGSGWKGNISSSAPNSTGFSAGLMAGGFTGGYTSGLGQGYQNVSGYSSYQDHLQMFNEDNYSAANAAWNPAYMAMRGFTEAGGGVGLKPSNLGSNLNWIDRTIGGAEGVLGTVGTVGAATGLTQLGSSSIAAFRQGAGGTTSLSPNSINFSQRTVGSNVAQYADDMSTGRWDWSRSGSLRVMETEGGWVSYDNRRLLAAQQTALDYVPVQVVRPSDMMNSTRTWGDAFNLRFNDPRNIPSVPSGGLATQPNIATPRR